MSQSNKTISNGSLHSAVPAFVSNERIRRKSAKANKNLTDCCFSISNLALIVACVVAIIFTAKFFNDDPLYDIGDYLLTLRFYRQLIYVIVILPLILLIPIFNAISAFFLSQASKQEIGQSILTVRICYQVLMVILVFIALAFIAPNMKASNVSNQVDHEIRRHIYGKYENQFSFEFLDRIQLEYECCDQPYYLANFNRKLPPSCYLQDGYYNTVFRYTCAEVLGYLVSTRCMIITICFIVILFALASLIAMDVIELVRLTSGYYDVEVHESRQSIQNNMRSNLAGSNGATMLAPRAKDDYDSDGLDNDDIISSDQISDRLKLEDRERENETLLLAKTNTRFDRTTSTFRDNNNQSKSPANLSAATSSPILTRANYLNTNRERPLSPIFLHEYLPGGSLGPPKEKPPPPPSSGVGPTPAKSSLKKSTSFSRIDSEVEEQEEEEEDAEEALNYRQQLQRELQTRRSLLNVRFAE